MSDVDTTVSARQKVAKESVDVKALIDTVLPHMKQKSRLGAIDTDIDGTRLPSLMINRLKAIHHRILFLTIEGKSMKEIAADVNYTVRMIGIIQTSPAFKREQERIMEKSEGRAVTLASRVNILKHEAMDVMEEQLVKSGIGLSATEQRLRVDVAKDIIERSGDVPNIQKSQTFVAHLTKEDIAELKLRATKKIAPGDKHWEDPSALLKEQQDG